MWSVPALGTSPHFWESECDNIKTQLITMDKRGTGRAPLSRFSGVFFVMVSSRSAKVLVSIFDKLLARLVEQGVQMVAVRLK